MSKNAIYLLDDGDVIRVDQGDLPFINGQTCLTQDILKSRKEQHYSGTSEQKIFSEGLDCRVLRPGQKQWMVGKIRFVLELELNSEQEDELDATESDSLLDEIRKSADV